MEKSSFVLVFGETPVIKVLDFLLTFDSFDYSIGQISKETETKWESVENALRFLISKGIVKKTRKLGKAQLYMLDKEGELAKLLKEIDFRLSRFFIENEMKRQTLRH
ncbi:hypothetical protein J4466_00735 [Candidatus Pacearchaeota archaeon]|nr:hypothetical protein [Candidatus Pacearchaeota archaeon]